MENSSKAGKNKPIKLGSALDALEGIIGYSMPRSNFQGTIVAEKLNIDATVWSAKRNGRAVVGEGELSKIIDIYRLGSYGLDFRIFRAESENQFLEILKEAGVGTYGPHASGKFKQLLYTAGKNTKACRIGLIGINEPYRRGGIGFGPGVEEKEPTIRIGGTVRILCEGPAKNHLLVFNERLGHEVTVLAPSQRAPHTFQEEGTVVLPTSLDWERFDIQGPSGRYRLYGLWTTGDVAEIVNKKLNPDHPRPEELSDETMAQLYNLLHRPGNNLVAAFQDYVVEER